MEFGGRVLVPIEGFPKGLHRCVVSGVVALIYLREQCRPQSRKGISRRRGCRLGKSKVALTYLARGPHI